jgi:hypothetical protein
MAEKPKTIKVKTLAYHTAGGDVHDVDDLYDVDEAALENLLGQGLVVRAEDAPAPVKASKPVKPMTTKHTLKKK